jgi:acyl carrier protein
MTREHEIRNRIARFFDTPLTELDWKADLDTLSIGSLQFVEVVVDLQEEFDVALFHDDMDRIACLDDLVNILDGRIQHGPSFGRVSKGAAQDAAASA